MIRRWLHRRFGIHSWCYGWQDGRAYLDEDGILCWDWTEVCIFCDRQRTRQQGYRD